jgi:hypothetical protein
MTLERSRTGAGGVRASTLAIVLPALAGAGVAIAALAALDDRFIPGRGAEAPGVEGGGE